MFCLAFCIYLSCSQFKTNKQKTPTVYWQLVTMVYWYSLWPRGGGWKAQTCVALVLQQEVCFLSKNLQRDCYSSCLLQYMSQHSVPRSSRFHVQKKAILLRQYIPYCCQWCICAGEDALLSRPGLHLATEVVNDLSSQIKYFGQRSDFKKRYIKAQYFLFVCSVRHCFSIFEIQKAFCMFIPV